MKIVSKIVIAAKKFWAEITASRHKTEPQVKYSKQRPHAVHRNQVRP